mgnify:FL=1
MPNDLVWRESVSDEELKKFDKYAHAVTVISSQHRLIHDGMFFSGWFRNATLASGSKLYLGISVPASTYPHMQVVQVTADEGGLEVELYENSTYSGGSAVTMVNRNRNSSKTLSTSVVSAPTVTTEGTLIDFHILPEQGAGGHSGVNTKEEFGELALSSSTDYLIAVDNTTATTRDVTINIAAYELTYP